jgi:hypothetical protein
MHKLRDAHQVKSIQRTEGAITVIERKMKSPCGPKILCAASPSEKLFPAASFIGST